MRWNKTKTVEKCIGMLVLKKWLIVNIDIIATTKIMIAKGNPIFEFVYSVDINFIFKPLFDLCVNKYKLNRELYQDFYFLFMYR